VHRRIETSNTNLWTHPIKIALKIDVDTFCGTRVGVPALVRLLRAQGCAATFLFSLGPDHTGRAIRRVFTRGFLTKVRRTSVIAHYGFPTLFYGTLLPGPDIGMRCSDTLRMVRDEGFETGIHCWDHVAWQDGVVNSSLAWAKQQLELAQDRFTQIFKQPARIHGAAGWRMSRNAMRIAASMGFEYCSDGRSTNSTVSAFYPVMMGEIINCPQLPTNLPTLDELIGREGCTEANVHEKLLQMTDPREGESANTMHSHVFTLHAELEGAKLMPVFERLIAGWKRQGYALTTTGEIFRNALSRPLPYYHLKDGAVPGRSGPVLLTGERYAIQQPDAPSVAA
jgi:peptidoglycan/xylan/chitin deacetylase (PgdA/CDA1 family)